MTVANICDLAKHLAIAIPAYRGWVSVETSRMLNGVQLLLHNNDIKVDFYYVKRNPYLDDTRNVLTTIFLESSATDILFVDDDVGSTPDAVLKIAQAKRPFIAGIYPQKTEDGQIGWPVHFESPQVHFDEDGFIDNAIVVPTGFLRLNRAVFDALDHEDYQNHSEKLWKGFFRCGARDGWYYGEDPDFCGRWRALGGRIYIIPDLNFVHVGDSVWRGNFGSWLNPIVAETLPRNPTS